MHWKCLTLFTFACAAAADSAILNSEFIYESAPFPSCHASTIVEAKDGNLVAAWFGGTAERNPDVGIGVARRVNGKWTTPVEVANGVQTNGTRLPCWNPVLFQPSPGPLMLFYKVGPDPRRWWGMLRTSEDNGKAWSEATKLPDGILGPIKNKPVQLADGSILCPSSTESPGPGSQWRVHFERTKDLGKTWTTVSPAPAPASAREYNAIQPSILFHNQKNLQAIGRTTHGKIFTTSSEDGGQTWTPLTLTELPNPSSGTDAVTLRDGRHLLIYNDTPKGRSPLKVAISRDGLAWKNVVVLEDEPNAEFSYPAIIQTSKGLVEITYTWKRKRIKHATLDPSRLE